MFDDVVAKASGFVHGRLEFRIRLGRIESVIGDENHMILLPKESGGRFGAAV